MNVPTLFADGDYERNLTDAEINDLIQYVRTQPDSVQNSFWKMFTPEKNNSLFSEDEE